MDVDLYLDSSYYGYFPVCKIEAYFERYEHDAKIIRNLLDWDEVLLYAIYAYDNNSDALLSAEFMLIRIPYDSFIKLCSDISENCRLFFIRNK